MDIKSSIGSRVRKQRNLSGFSQEKLAELTDVSVSSISRLENGQHMVSVEKLIEIAKALNVGIETILYDFSNKEDGMDEETSQFVLLLERCTPEGKERLYHIVRMIMDYAAGDFEK